MNTRLILSGAVALIIILTVSGFLIFNEFSSLQAEIDTLQIQNRELEKEKSNLQNQSTVTLNRYNDVTKQMGDLTKQLALERHLKIEITTFWHNDNWFAYGGLLVGYPFNATIRNNDIVAVGGLSLTVQAFSGLKDETEIAGFGKIDLLHSGKEQVVSGEVVVYIGAPSNLNYVATLKAGEVVIDTFTLP